MSNTLPAISDEEISHLNVYGARVHNLKDIDVHIPRNRFVVITGLSGSGKSSLAFDTIYAEGQRRYMESFANYARQFLGTMERPDVEKVTGLSPVISIEQKTTSRNPRSTVGTTTEIYDFLRLLYARAGEAISYNTGKKMVRYTEEQVVDHIGETLYGQRILILAPVVRGRKGHYRELFEQIRKQGYLKVRVDGEILEIQPKMQVDRYKIHDIEIVVDRLKVDDDLQRLRSSVRAAFRAGKGLLFILDYDSGAQRVYSKQLMCPDTGLSYEEPSPNTFSFNSPYGACPRCKGLGTIQDADLEKIIPDKKQSIRDGGIAPLGMYRDTLTFQLVKKVLQKFGLQINTPVNELPEEALGVLLYGSGAEGVEVDMDYAEVAAKYKISYEGIIPQLFRAYTDDSSEPLRRWAESYLTERQCPVCAGFRLKKDSLWFHLDGKHIGEISRLDLSELLEWVNTLEGKLSSQQAIIAKDILKELRDRTGFLLDVGLHYLSLDRPTGTLSGGESQRIRLASQIGSQLMGITYILDEPSIGLHQRDNRRLIHSLQQLASLGNTVLVVEHDKDIMLASDYIIDLGPAAGEHGGEVVANGSPEEFVKSGSLTARYLSGDLQIAVPKQRRRSNGKQLVLTGASGHNLKNVTLEIPLGTFTCITGVSGSGKSTLINETLYRILNQYFYNAVAKPMPFDSIKGLEYIDKVIEIDQAPIGRTPRSNPATYVGLFDGIRQLFASTPEAKIRGYAAGRFSFNVKGGRCEECEGGGMKLIEMNFLPDVYVECPRCLGRRYNRETLEVRYKGKNISDVLSMTIDEATIFFESIPKIHRKLKTLEDVGLGYIRLGQQATTLSGGEAQRVKLSEELSKKDTGRTLYILDEPTTGLHFEDIRVLLEVLQRLVGKGNTVVVIEHNLDVVKVADHVIDLGPEGGSGGGYIVVCGTPEEVAAFPGSITGAYLRQELV